MTKVWVTGGHGFLGRHIVAKLEKEGYTVVNPSMQQVDLMEPKQICRFLSSEAPGIIVHAAAKVGGIKANKDFPADFLRLNTIMGLNVMEEAIRHDVKKFVQIGTACSYPENAPLPFNEKDLFGGNPEPTNSPYGLAKRLLVSQAQAYRKQCGLNAISLILTNLYGPGDNFDLDTSHIIPAAIAKLYQARRNGSTQITFWGDGRPTRDFLYVEDAAQGIVDAMKYYNEPEPLNLGSGNEYSISFVIREIAEKVGYYGNYSFMNSTLNGQSRRVLDISRARDFIGFNPKTPLSVGLGRTIHWYEHR